MKNRIQKSEYRIQKGEPRAGAMGRRVYSALNGQMAMKMSELTRLRTPQPAQPGLTRFNPHEFFLAKRRLNAICGARRERQRCGPEAGRGGKRRVGRRVYVGKGGRHVVGGTVFSHLFPPDSTQVVDFPHLSAVRVFWISVKFDFQSQAEFGTCMGKWSAGVLEYWRGAMRNVTGCCAKVREVSRKSTKVRTDQARKSSMFGFPSPPQVRCPKWVVRLRETWSHCYG